MKRRSVDRMKFIVLDRKPELLHRSKMMMILSMQLLIKLTSTH